MWNTDRNAGWGVFEGDCLIGIKEIPDRCVDLVLTDPPYNISKSNQFHTMGRAGIDFGEWDKGFDLTTWMGLIPRVLSRDASIIIFNDWKNMGEIARYGETLGWVVKDMIRWEKSNPMPRNRDRRYITDFEVAVWFTASKKARWTFNRQSDTYQRPVIRGASPRGKGRHPTEKPVGILVDLLRIHTNEGDVVLDPFMGSASCGIAALSENRRFIGCEKDRPFCTSALRRLRAACPARDPDKG